MRHLLSYIIRRTRRAITKLTTATVTVISLLLTNPGVALPQDPNATLPSKSKPATNSDNTEVNNSAKKSVKRRRRSSAGPVARGRQRRLHADREAEEARAAQARERSSEGAVARERQRRLQAQQEAAEARAAQARAEQAERRKKDVWFMATVRNSTNGQIPYQVLCRQFRTSFSLNPGYQIVHICLNDDITVEYDYKYQPGYQKRIIRAVATPVIGHSPTESEQATARVNVFQIDINGDIGLYYQ